MFKCEADGLNERYLMATNQSTSSKWRHCKKVLKIAVFLPLFIGTLLLLVAILRTLAVRIPPSTILHALQGHDIDMIDESQSMDRARRLAGALAIPTISYAPGNQEYAELLNLHEYLKKSFPLIHASTFITRDVVNTYSLLFTVQGTSNATLPYLLASHLDVVPVNEATWHVPPFSGTIVNDTYIYGRGAIDVKCGVMGILESLEYMLQKGKRPKRTFYIAFGHDEEVGGMHGAKKIAELLTARGVTALDFLIDEGLPMTRGLIPGTDGLTVAMLGVTEKGQVSLELTVQGTPGHSSIPPPETAIGILAAAIARLEANPQPSKFGKGPEALTFSETAPHCSFLFRLIYHNFWLFAGIMSKVMERKPLTNAIARTTTAITMFNGGVKENVVPASATAVVNLRIHPSQSVAEIVSAVSRIVDDPRVVLRSLEGSAREAHPVTPTGSTDVPYQLVTASLKQVFGNDVIVVPGVLVGNTDTRWYLSFTGHIFRQFPLILRTEDVATIHGDNERLTVSAYHLFVNYYYRVINNADLLLDVVPATTEHYGAEL